MDDLLEKIKAFGATIKNPGGASSQKQALEKGASELGIDPVDYATAISYETGGTFDPWQAGPVTKWGQHRGTIQYGEPQRKKYGVYEGQSFEDQVSTSNVKYLRDAGVKPGMKFAQIYSAINGGSVNADPNTQDSNTGRTIADNIRNAERDHRLKVIDRFGFTGSPTKSGPDFSRVREMLGQTEAAPQEAVSPDFSSVRAILDGQTGDVNAKSRPAEERLTTPTKQTPAHIQTPQATAPVGRTDQVDMNDPGVQAALAAQRAQLNDADVDPQAQLDLQKYAGIKGTGSAPRVLGKATDDLHTVAGSYTPVSFKDDRDASRQAINYALGKYGVTPQETDAYLAKQTGPMFAEGAYQAGKPIDIPFSILAEIKGKDHAVGEIRSEQAQSRTDVGGGALPPKEVMTPEIMKQLNDDTSVLQPLAASGDFNQFLGANLAAGVLRSGSSTWNGLAGIYNQADKLVRGTFESNARKMLGDDAFKSDLQVAEGDDIYKYMATQAARSEKPAHDLAEQGGGLAEVFQTAGALPGDLARISLLSRLPGGIYTGMSVDMASQAAGQGADESTVALQGLKGLIYAGIAKAIVPTAKGWANNTGSKIAGFAAGTAQTGAATYVTSRLFGADEKTALRETLYNTIFGMGDGVTALRGHTARVKGVDGAEYAVKIDHSGGVKEVTLKPGEHADLEIYDANKPIVNKAEVKPEGMDDMAYEKQKAAASEHLANAGAVDKTVSAMQGKAKIENGVLKVDGYGNMLLGEAAARGLKQPIDFYGMYLRPSQTSALIDGLQEIYTEYTDRGDTAAAKNVREFANQVMQARDSVTGDLVVGTDFSAIAPDLDTSIVQEELVHRNNFRSGVRALLEHSTIRDIDLQMARYQMAETGYGDTTVAQQFDEAIAKVFRDDAEQHLNMSKKDTRSVRKGVYNELVNLDVDPVQYAEGLKDVSQKGAAFERYARLKARPNRATNETAAAEDMQAAVDEYRRKAHETQVIDGVKIPYRESPVVQSTLGKTDKVWLETPTANAVEAAVKSGERTIASGFFSKITKDSQGWDRGWGIAFRGDNPSAHVVHAAEAVGLTVTKHPKGETYYVHADGISAKGLAQAETLFNSFARELETAGQQKIETGDFVTTKADPQGKPYIVHRIEGENAVLVDAYQVDPAEIQHPLSELDLHTKVAHTELATGRVEEADILSPEGKEQMGGAEEVSPVIAAAKEAKLFNKADHDAIQETIENDFPALAKWFGRKPNDAPDKPVHPNPAVEARFEESHGIPKENQFKKAVDSVVKVYQSFRRTYHELDPNKSEANALVNDAFRRLSVVPHWSKAKAQNTIAEITNDLGPNNLRTFEWIVQLRDIQREVEKGLLPELGMADLKEVNDSLAHFEAEAAKYPEIQKALDLRAKKVEDLTSALVRIDRLPDSVLADGRYYHRQILSAIDNNYASVGSQDVRLHLKGFQKARQGEQGDFNTNYLESEGEWMAQAHAQLAKYGIQQEIEAATNTAPDLKAKAKLTGVTDWKSLIDKKTHTLWQPAEGNYFFAAESFPEQALLDLLSGILDKKDVPAELKEVLAMGRRKPEWVVPKEVASLLDRFQPDRPEAAISQITAQINSATKVYMLNNPKAFAGYNLRNAISDLDVVIARYPGALKEVWNAYNMLRDHSKNPGGASTQFIEDAIANGVIDSGQTFAEIPDINKIKAFKNFTSGDWNPLVKAWDGAKNFSNFRENLLRLAVYKHLLPKVTAGEPVYGGSNKFQVDAITDPNLKAAKIAREFMGDYGGISEAGRVVRKHMLPFYSWMEINAPRYVRMLKNIPHEGDNFKALPALAAKGAKLAVNTPRLAVRMAALTGAMVMWNNYGPFAEEEAKLNKTDIGRQPHLIVGQREDGTPMLIRSETALSDALSWLDLGDVDADITGLKAGTQAPLDVAGDALKAPLNRFVNAVGPIYKLPVELAFDQTTYPSLFQKGWSMKLNKRPIKDSWEYAARTASVDAMYKWATGRPAPQRESATPGGAVRTVLDWTLTSRVDSDEAVYFSARTNASRYAEKLGKSSQAVDSTEKGNALYYYRMGIKLGDTEAAARYLDKYKKLSEAEGKTDKDIQRGIETSIKKSHPLGGLDSEVWGQYIRSLNQEDRNQLALALGFYKNAYDQKETIGDSNGASVQDLYQTVFPKPVRLIAENNTSISMAVDIFENAGLSAADSARVKSAIQLKAIQKIHNKSITLEDQSALTRIGIKYVTNSDIKSLNDAGDQQKKVQELRKAAKFGYN